MDAEEAQCGGGEESEQREGDGSQRDERAEEQGEPDAVGEDRTVRAGEALHDGVVGDGGAGGPAVHEVREEVAAVVGQRVKAEVAQGLPGNQVVGLVTAEVVALRAQEDPGGGLTHHGEHGGQHQRERAR